jgi:hypothetical protein
VEIPVGKASHVFVRMDSAGWHVAGHLPAASFSVQPLKHVVHDGFLVASELSSLELVEADERGLRLAVRAPPVVRRARPPSPETYACDAVNLGPPPLLDATAALPGDPKARRPVALALGEVPLSLEPGAAPAAWLLLSESPRNLVELGRSGAHRRIAMNDFTTLVFGWVPETWVRTPPKAQRGAPAGAMGGGTLAVGALGGRPGSRDEAPKPAIRSCPTALRLLARVGGDVMQVGTVDPGTPITVSQREGAVQLDPPAWLKLAEGATLETPGDALSRCSP